MSSPSERRTILVEFPAVPFLCNCARKNQTQLDFFAQNFRDCNSETAP